MPTRGLLFLTTITAIAVFVCWIAIDTRYRGTEFEKHDGGFVFPGFRHKINAVAEIHIARMNGDFVLARQGNTWANTGIGGFPATLHRVEATITAVANLKFLEPKTKRKRLYRKLGVEDFVAADAKSARLIFKDGGGTIFADIIVGKPKETYTPPQLYVRLPEEPRAWLVSGKLDVHDDAVSWSDRRVANINQQDLMSLTIVHPDGMTLALHRRQPSDRKFTLKGLADSVIKHQHQIDYLAGLMEDLKFSDAKRVVAPIANVASAYEITAETKDHLAVTLRVDTLDQDGSAWVTLNAKVTDETPASDRIRQEAASLRDRFQGWSIKLPRKVADRLKIRIRDITGSDITNERRKP